MFDREHIDEELRKWSRQVKMRDGWVCTHPDCGELDRTLLDAHHKLPRHRDLTRQSWFDVSNGECLCLYCHSKAHSGEWAEMAVLSRLGKILYQRLYPNRKFE